MILTLLFFWLFVQAVMLWYVRKRKRESQTTARMHRSLQLFIDTEALEMEIEASR